MAWKDMKRRLDEDDDDKIVVPPPRSGCGIGALLIGLLLFGGFWFLLRPEKWFTKKENETAQQTKRDVKENKTEVKTENNASEVEGEIEVKQDQNIDKITQKDTANTQSTTDNPNERDRSKITIKNSDIKSTTKGSEPLTIKDEVTIQTNDHGTKKRKANIQPVKTNRPENASKVQNKKAKKNNIDEGSVSNQKKKQGTEDV
jgi:FtsZ-interacting cell division protein ZipA